MELKCVFGVSKGTVTLQCTAYDVSLGSGFPFLPDKYSSFCLYDVPRIYFFSRQVAAAVDYGNDLHAILFCTVDDPIPLKDQLTHVVPIGLRDQAPHLWMVLKLFGSIEDALYKPFCVIG